MSTAPSPARPVPAGELRPEIQALRAFAVLVVLLYHLWPLRLTGGFIGVDVFFVVSGFLITAHLVRELRGSSRIRLGRFWARRARRLLPASFLVLAVTAVGVLAVVPMGLWQQFFREIGASALYVENWALAADSVDYLAAENVPSPVQHYWSLGVEEQLYLVWPVLLTGVALLLRSRPRLLTIGLTTAVAASLVLSLLYSSILVAEGSAVAYFVTPGRVWEFAAGGLLALLATGRPLGLKVAAGAAWIGWAGLAACAVAWTSQTPFPGYGAIPVVIFTLLVLLAGSPEARWAPTGLVRIRPVQWLGDVSYSAYLWHWPLIVLLPFALGRTLSSFDKIGVLVVTLGLAWASTRLVENPIRFSVWGEQIRPSWVLAAAVTLSLLFTSASAGVWAVVQRQNDRAVAEISEREDSLAHCFGAGSLTDPTCVDIIDPQEFFPPVAAATQDVPAIYTKACRSETTDPAVKACHFGPSDGPRVALIGDSHAASWFPAILRIAEDRGWSLTVYFKGACAFSSADRDGPAADKVASCLKWNEDLSRLLEVDDPYDIVFTVSAAMTDYLNSAGEVSGAAAVEGFRQAWAPLLERGTMIVPIRDLPMLGSAGAACQIDNPSDPSVCAQERDSALQLTDWSMDAARSLDLPAIDMTDYFCKKDLCPTVVGGVLVYRDAHHFTATYARSLAPMLERELIDVGVLDER